MNHIYRVIFNHSANCWQAVSEIGRGKHKIKSEKSQCLEQCCRFTLLPLSAMIGLALNPVYAAPQGGEVSAGQAVISSQHLTTDIHQSSQNAAINWQKFDIQPNETVNFHQPNAQAITLNRVIGNEESVIRGAMNANGNVFISNPNGVLIGKEAQINVGSLVATTQQLKDDDLMNGKLKFSGQAGGKVENLANITVPKGGVIALIAPIVKNSGKLTASEGTVLLASAEQFAITLPKDNFSYTIERGTLQGLIDNQGAILADGGRVVLTAKGLSAVKKSVIKHSGSIEANTVSNKNGVVELLGDLDNSELQMSGSIKAEAPNGGNGGFVETSAAKVKIEKTAKVSTKAKNGKTGEWLIDPTDFTVHAGEGEKTTSGIGATTLQSSLTETNVTLATAAGGSEDGNIYVNAPVTWNKNRLTLSAHNDIHINKPLNGTGSAKLALEYGQGSADGGEADYYLEKNTPLVSRTVKVNLPEGKNFTTKKGSQGEVVEYEVIHQMPEIVRNENERYYNQYWYSCNESCEQWKSQFTASNIAFGKDIDLSHTANYQGFAGWDVPSNSLPVRIEGLGHQVDNLTLASKKDAQSTGLFTWMHDDLGTIRNIGVTNMNISSVGWAAHTGGLVGRGGGSITNSYATGSVTTSWREAYAGGLVGYGGGSITNSYATGSVATSRQDAYAGGLVGRGGESITNSYATGSVTTSGLGADAGGLVGVNGQNISNSYATGSVTTSGAAARAGGLVGESGQNITNSYATGSVATSGENGDAGGLVGESGQNITNSYATGSVTTSGIGASAGGLVGVRGSHIINSYATGSVATSGEKANAGGLVGSGYNITNSYATGSVTTLGDNANAGGVLGKKAGWISESSLNFTNTYFNMNQVSSEKGEVSRYGTGVSEQALKQKATFENWDFDTIWRIDEGRDTPRLRALTERKIVVTPDPEKTEAGITANNLSKTYDGEAVNTEADLAKLEGWNGTGYTVSGLKEGDSADSIFNGGLTFNGARSTWKGAVNAGEYVLDPTADLTEAAKQKYEIVWNTGKLTINKRPLSLIGTKTYNGNPFVRAGDFTRVNGFVEKDKVLIYDNQNKLLTDTLSGSVSATGSEVREEAYRLKDSVGLTLKEALAKNYEINPANSMVFVTPAALKVSLHGRRQYDGTKDAVVDDNTVLEGQVGNDDVSLVKGGKGTLKSENAGKQPLVDLGNIALTGAKAKNYKLTTEGSYWDIAKKPLVVQALDNYEFIRASDFIVDGWITDVFGNRRYAAGENTKLRTQYGAVANGLIEKDKSQVNSLDIKSEYLHADYDALVPSNLTFKNQELNNNYEVSYKSGRLYLIREPNKVNNALFNIKGFPLNGKFHYAEPEGLKNLYKDLHQHKDELYLADIVYNRDFQPDDNRFQLVASHHEPNNDGLQMALYKKGEQYYIAYRGTDIRPNDIAADIALSWGNSDQQRKSFEKSKEWLREYVPADSRITLLGHSLGGNLAQYNATLLGRKLNLVTFNSAPFISNNGEKHQWVTPLKDIYAKHFVFDNDVLQGLGGVNSFTENFNPFNYKSKDKTGTKDYYNYFPSGKTKVNFFEHGSIDDHTLTDVNEVVRVVSSLHHNYEVLSDKDNVVIKRPSWISTYARTEQENTRPFRPKPEENIQVPKLEAPVDKVTDPDKKLPPVKTEPNKNKVGDVENGGKAGELKPGTEPAKDKTGNLNSGEVNKKRTINDKSRHLDDVQDERKNLDTPEGQPDNQKKIPPLEVEIEGTCASITLSQDICNSMMDSLIKSGMNKANATLMTKAFNALMSNMMNNLESTQEIREFFGKFGFLGINFGTGNFMNQMGEGMTEFTKKLAKDLEAKSKLNIGFKPTLFTMKDIVADAITEFVKSEVKSQVLKTLPTEGKLKYVSPVIADTISSAVGNVFSELAKGKVNIDLEKVLSSFIKSSAKELKKQIVSNLISEESYWREAGDFIGDVAVEAINSFAKSVIKNKGISAKAIAQFEVDFTIQLATLSSKEVLKNVEIAGEIKGFEQDFMRQQANSIIDRAANYQRAEKYREIGEPQKADSAFRNYQAVIHEGYSKHIDLKADVVTNIDMKLAQAYLKLQEFRITGDADTEREIRAIMDEIEPYASSQKYSGKAGDQGGVDQIIGGSPVGHGISNPMDYYTNMANLLGLGGYRSSELKPKVMTDQPNLSGSASPAPKRASLNIR